MTRAVPILAAMLALACGACAMVGEEAGEVPADISTAHQCFFVSQVNGYSEAPDGPGGRDRLYVKTGVNDRWLLEPFAGCPNLNWANNIALNTRNFSTLCTGDTAELLVPSGISGHGVDRCTARILGKVSVPR